MITILRILPVATFVATWFVATAISTAQEVNGKQPNVLFIIADDQSPFDLKVYNPDSILDTPNIDRLATEGMTIDEAYHMGSFSGAVCTPSRHMVMTGRTLWHLPISIGKKICPPDYEQFSTAAIFNVAGYDTMRTCKKGNSYPAANKQFTIVRDATKRGGTEESGSAWHGRQVLDYLNQREASKDHDPFLSYFGFSHPHDTRDGTPELLGKYGASNEWHCREIWLKFAQREGSRWPRWELFFDGPALRKIGMLAERPDG